MSDSVFVKGLVLHAYHGVMQHEAKVGQTFRLDLKLSVDLAEASRTDMLKHTVSYDTVVKTASEAFCGHRYRLVEAAAGAVADAVLTNFSQVQCGRRHRTQAARADRRHFRRCGRDDRARAPRSRRTLSREADYDRGVSRAWRQSRRRARDLRTRHRNAVRRCCRDA